MDSPNADIQRGRHDTKGAWLGTCLAPGISEGCLSSTLRTTGQHHGQIDGPWQTVTEG
jgi:hypothetical protein